MVIVCVWACIFGGFIICPINKYCIAYQNTSYNIYTIKNKKIIKTHYNIVIGVIKNQNHILISKRYQNGLLGGLWEFPGGKIKQNES